MPSGFSQWRDPDSNRGHHDFRACGLDLRKGEIPGDQAVLGGSRSATEVRNLRTFPPDSGDGALSSPFRGDDRSGRVLEVRVVDLELATERFDVARFRPE